MTNAKATRHSWWPDPLVAPLESDIIKLWDKRNPKISILCATFNQESYIADALNGFLSQKSAYPFEIIVRDDASTDSTAELVRSFALRYPRIVTAIFESENRYPELRPNEILFDASSGSLVSICEGDDYWTDEYKLADQAEILTKFPRSSLVVARHWELLGESRVRLSGAIGVDPNACTFVPSVEDLKEYFHTSTYMMNRQHFQDWMHFRSTSKCQLGDTALRYFSLSRGPIAVLDRPVSAYRITGEGIWTSLDSKAKTVWDIRVAKFLIASIPEQSRFHRRRLFSFRYGLLKLAVKNGLRSLMSPVFRRRQV